MTKRLGVRMIDQWRTEAALAGRKLVCMAIPEESFLEMLIYDISPGPGGYLLEDGSIFVSGTRVYPWRGPAKTLSQK
jgi:hypothetical protein